MMRWAIVRRLAGMRPAGAALVAAGVGLGLAAYLAAMGAAALAQAPSGRAAGQSPSAQRGVVIARTYCARCHSIDKLSPSPLAEAPPLRDLHKRYPVERLEEPLAEGLVTGHPSMPEFSFDPGQIGDFIAFLKSLE